MERRAKNKLATLCIAFFDDFAKNMRILPKCEDVAKKATLWIAFDDVAKNGTLLPKCDIVAKNRGNIHVIFHFFDDSYPEGAEDAEDLF